ncbi:MAG: hypothetical protein AAGI11_06865 [Pseudomonadota bacterium]
MMLIHNNKEPRFPRAVVLLVTLGLVSLVSACRLNIQPIEDTPVVSESGSFICESQRDCRLDIVDTTFDETFRAVAPENTAFTGWAEGDNYLCAGSMRDCRVNSALAAFSPELQDILESNERYFLAPTTERHFRELLEAPYLGKQIELVEGEERSEPASKPFWVEISADNNRVDMRPDQESTLPGCYYQGRFDVREEVGRSALEVMSGTYTCNRPPFESGTYVGRLYRPGHASLFVEIEQTSTEGELLNVALALVRDSEGSQQAPLIDCCIARAAGRPLTAAALGAYSGGMAELSTSQCSILQTPRARSNFVFEADESGRLTIFHNDEEGPDCTYQQDESGMLQGSYNCDDGSDGFWGTAKLKGYRSSAGRLFDLSFLQSPSDSCSFEVNFYGAQAG